MILNCNLAWVSPSPENAPPVEDSIMPPAADMPEGGVDRRDWPVEGSTPEEDWVGTPERTPLNVTCKQPRQRQKISAIVYEPFPENIS